jgi:hypothetical protein
MTTDASPDGRVTAVLLHQLAVECAHDDKAMT